MDNVAASIRMTTNNKFASIIENVVTEDVVAIVDSISNWVAKHSGKAIDITPN